MSLLTPLFLLGLAGIALPIWLHRLQTQTTEREKFSSTMFLEAAKRRIHVQRKLKYLLLLAFRILLLAILVFAFARPILELSPQAVLGDEDTHHVIVLDSSFSMQRGDNFDSAVEIARGIIGDMEAGDQASLFTASSRVATVLPPSTDADELNQALSALSPDNGRLNLGAMVAALDGLITETQARVELHLISDFQESGQPVRFADMVPDVINGRPVTLDLQRVTPDSQPNWAVEAVVVGIGEVSVNVRGFNTEAADRTVQLSVNGQPAGELSRTVPASGRANYLFEDLEFAGGDNRIDARLQPGDELPADDLRHTVLDNAPPAPVLLLTSDPDSLAVTYITAALETAPRPYRAEVTDIADLDTRVLQRYPWLIIEDLGMVNQSLAQALSDYVNNGGAVLAALGERSASLSSLPVTGHTPAGSLNLRAGSRRSITRIDSSHPALQQASSWAGVNITQVLPLEPAAQDNVLITLDTNTPLLLERRMGQGRFMLLNTSLDNTWTDLPLKPVFVGFMAEAARYLSGENVLQREQVADSFLQLQSAGQVFDPEGESLLSLEATSQAQELQLRRTGYYEVVTPAGEMLIAVNPDLRESDLTVMAPEVLQNWQNTVANTAGNNPAQPGAVPNAAAAGPAADTVEVEIWRVFLIMLVIVVLAESLLGNRYLRVNTGVPE